MIIQQKNKTRTFISINLSNNEKIVLSKRIDKFQVLMYAKTQTKVKIVDPLNYHITIAFLSSVSKTQLSILKKELEFVTHNFSKPFHCKIIGLGVFPNIKSARLIFLDVDSIELQELAKQIRKVVIKNGFKLDLEFKAHITIAKFKDKIELNDLDKITASFSTDSFFLMQSILTNAGPIYSKLEKFPFA